MFILLFNITKYNFQGIQINLQKLHCFLIIYVIAAFTCFLYILKHICANVHEISLCVQDPTIVIIIVLVTNNRT